MIGVMNNSLQETRLQRLDDGSRSDDALIEMDRRQRFICIPLS
jgi:hypothetical protein